jgi:hypothetical protein
MWVAVTLAAELSSYADAKRTGSSDIVVEPLELDDVDSVQAFVNRWQGPLNILVKQCRRDG